MQRKPDYLREELGNISFFQIAETANDVIVVTTPELDSPGPRIIYVNPAFTRLTGYSAAEAIGRNPRMLQGPGTSHATTAAIRAALAAGRPVHEKILNFTKSGTPYWLDLKIVALHDARGEVTHFAAIERDITQEQRRLDELEHLADRDTLTGVANRRAFLRAANGELDAVAALGPAAPSGKLPCMLFIDVDHFKKVNDELGHAAGDAVLRGVADRLAANLRQGDILGRIGGEEFAVCMPQASLEEARALAGRLRRAVSAAQLKTPIGPVSVTVSIGIACFSPGENVVALTERADAAMYAAKRAGRNCVRAKPRTASASS